MLIRRISPHSLLCLGHYDIDLIFCSCKKEMKVLIISIPDSFSNIFYSKNNFRKVHKCVNVKSLTTGNKLFDYNKRISSYGKDLEFISYNPITDKSGNYLVTQLILHTWLTVQWVGGNFKTTRNVTDTFNFN